MGFCPAYLKCVSRLFHSDLSTPTKTPYKYQVPENKTENTFWFNNDDCAKEMHVHGLTKKKKKYNSFFSDLITAFLLSFLFFSCFTLTFSRCKHISISTCDVTKARLDS